MNPIDKKPAREISIERVESGKWYLSTSYSTHYGVFEKPNIRSRYLTILNPGVIFFVVSREKSHKSDEPDHLHQSDKVHQIIEVRWGEAISSRIWVYIGVGDIFGWVSFPSGSQATEVTETWEGKA